LKPINNTEFEEFFDHIISAPTVSASFHGWKKYGFDTDLIVTWLKKFLFQSARCGKVCKKIIFG
jgi:hypothetical protein